MLGIDTAKDELVAKFVEAGARKGKWEMAVPNAPKGVLQLLQNTPPGVPWVIEPTGRYSIAPVQQALAAGQEVLLAPPRKAKAFLNSLQDRAKTDRLDAQGLALFGLSRDASVPLLPYPIKKAHVDELDQLLSARKGLSRARSSLALQAKELPYARPVLAASLKEIDAQIETLDKQIEAATKQHADFEAVQRIDAVPGIGPVTAAAATARLAAKEFKRPDQWVAYLGMDIGVIQSGKRKGERGLTKQGDAELRRLFYLCAQSTLRCKESPFKAQYERELAKKLSKTAAICAVARKLAKLCWSLYTHGTSYDPERVYQQPAPDPATGSGEQAPG